MWSACAYTDTRHTIIPVYMQDKLNNARGMIYTIGLAILVIVVVWKLIVR